jgi:hypothetical protein
MLANLLLTLTAGVALLALLDLFLDDAQKASLSKWVALIWNYLDDLRTLSLVDWIRQPTARLWMAVCFAVAILVFGSLGIATIVTISKEAYILVTVISMLYVAVGLLIIAQLLDFMFKRQLWFRLSTVLFGGIAILFVMLLLLVTVSELRLTYIAIPLLIFIMVPLSMVVSCAAILFISIALAYVATAALYVGEFVVRRIAEYPKGPILALSAIFGSLVALIKVFAH